MENGDVELTSEPNMTEFAGCQLAPNKLGIISLLELTPLALEEEAEFCPETTSKSNSLEAEIELEREIPLEKVVFPVTKNNG